MTGGRSLLRQWPTRTSTVLWCAAEALALVAGLCWLRASLSPVEPGPGGGDGELDLHWWSVSVVAGGIAVALLVWFAATVRGRTGQVAVAAVLTIVVVGAAVFVWLVVPRANPIHPIGAAVPYAIAGFATAAGACVLIVLFVACTGGWSELPVTAAPGRRRARVLAVALAVLLASGTGLLVSRQSQAYLLRVNEYRTLGEVDSAPGSAEVSQLSGGDNWRTILPGLSQDRPVVTDFGIAVAAGDDVVMVDRATGVIRWQYTRSDIDGAASIGQVDGRVLAWWGDERTVHVLDARTGERQTTWSWARGPGRTVFLDPLLPLVARTGVDGSARVMRLDTHGDPLWTYPLGPCENPRARSVEGLALITVSSCDGSTRVTALAADTGRRLWSTPITGDLLAGMEGAAIVIGAPDSTSDGGSITVLDLADGSVRWTGALPSADHADNGCIAPQVFGAGRTVEVVCDFQLTDGLSAGAYLSTVRLYDAVSGATLAEKTYQDSILAAAMVTQDGKAVVLRGDWERGCVLERIRPSSPTSGFTVVPGSIHECGFVALLRVDGQVLAADAARAELRSLR